MLCPLPDPPLNEDEKAEEALDKAEARLLLALKADPDPVAKESSPVLVKLPVSESNDELEVEEGVGVMAVSPTSEQQPFPAQTTG